MKAVPFFIPIEIKLNSVVNNKSLRGLEIFLSDMKCDYSIVVNRGEKVELQTDKIEQVPDKLILHTRAVGIACKTRVK